MSCAQLETVAAYCLGELPEALAEPFEEHYFDCERCLARLGATERLLAQLGQALPYVLTERRHAGLAGRAPSLRAVHVQPGQRAEMRLGADAEFGVWVIQAPLAGVSRVDVEARLAEGGVLFALTDVPFDAERGEVLLACRAHYREIAPSRMLVRLTATRAAGPEPVGEYILDHVFESL